MFLGGITGQFFRQFAVTISVSTVISAFNSMTLSPALAAILLQPRDAKPDVMNWLLNLALGWFFQTCSTPRSPAGTTDLYKPGRSMSSSQFRCDADLWRPAVPDL